MPTYELIKTLNFFKVLDKIQIKKLLEISSIHTYSQDYILYYEQTRTKYLYFLISGLAKSYKIDKNENEIFLYYIQPDSIISEVSTLNEKMLVSYSNIVFIEDSYVLRVDYELFLNHFIQNGVLTYQLMQEIIKRNKKLETLINREFIFDAVTKVTMMIENDLEMFNKLKRHDIALILHIQPATLSRVLKKLKKDGIIDIVHGKVIKEKL